MAEARPKARLKPSTAAWAGDVPSASESPMRLLANVDQGRDADRAADLLRRVDQAGGHARVTLLDARAAPRS